MHTKYYLEHLKLRDDLGVESVYGGIILKWILKRLWTGFIWLWIWTDGGVL
jgi:hypothetical protein